MRGKILHSIEKQTKKHELKHVQNFATATDFRLFLSISSYLILQIVFFASITMGSDTSLLGAIIWPGYGSLSMSNHLTRNSINTCIGC